MFKGFFLTACIVGLSTQIQAFPCYFTVVKDSCWTQYAVTVTVTDTQTQTVMTSATVPAGQSWVRVSFSCTPSEQLMFQAQFTPDFWAQDKGKTYAGVNAWVLPAVVNASDSAWNIPVCFASDFAEVPLPPAATGNCVCDMHSVPEIPVPLQSP